MEAGGEKCAQFADCISLKRIERQVQRMTVGKTATTGSHGRESQSARAKSFWTAQWFSNEHVLSTSMHQTCGASSPKAAVHIWRSALSWSCARACKPYTVTLL